MMVFWRELRTNRKGLIIWSLCMFALVYLSMFKFDTISKGGTAVRDMFNQFPQSMQAMFGMSGLDITTVSGYYGILLLYIVIVAAIHAGMMGVDALAREERDHTTEFLFPKPMSRNRIITEKLFAGFVSIVVLNIVICISSLVSIALFVPIDSVLREVSLMMVAVSIVQIVFYLLGAASAALNSKRAGRIVAAAIFAGYIVYIISGMMGSLDWLRIVSPIAFFNAKDIIATMTLNGGYISCCIGVSLLALVVIYSMYNKRDLQV